MKIIKGPSIEELISKAYIGLGSASFIRVDEVRFFPSMFLLIRENDDILYKLRFLQKIQYPIGYKRVYRMLDGSFSWMFLEDLIFASMMQCIISVYFPLIPEQIFGSGSH